jgi:hypothetical protein
MSGGMAGALTLKDFSVFPLGSMRAGRRPRFQENQMVVRSPD